MTPITAGPIPAKTVNEMDNEPQPVKGGRAAVGGATGRHRGCVAWTDRGGTPSRCNGRDLR